MTAGERQCICSETVRHIGCPVAGHGWGTTRVALARAEAVVVAARDLCERVLGTTVDTGDVLVSPLDVDDLRSALAAFSEGRNA